MCIKWCGHGIDKLFTGGLDNIIHAYDVRDMKEKYNTKRDRDDPKGEK